MASRRAQRRSWCNTHNCQACGESVDVVTDAHCTDTETGLLCARCRQYGDQQLCERRAA